MPAIVAYKKAIKVSLINGAKNTYASIAPNNSEIPEINVYKKALYLLPVE